MLVEGEAHSNVWVNAPGLGPIPPKTKALVEPVIFEPAWFLFPVGKSVVSLQLLPFQSSTFAFIGGVPPENIAAGCPPDREAPDLAVFKSFCSDQADPFQYSVFA